MFDDLDATLTQVLNDAPSTELPELHNADVGFVTPDKTFAPAQPTVSLFLYEVRENRELRDPRPLVERNGDRFTRRMPPLRADCSYIVTTWGDGQPGATRIAAEHKLLGQALTWLSRFPTIPDRYLQGAARQRGPHLPAARHGRPAGPQPARRRLLGRDGHRAATGLLPDGHRRARPRRRDQRRRSSPPTSPSSSPPARPIPPGSGSGAASWSSRPARASPAPSWTSSTSPCAPDRKTRAATRFRVCRRATHTVRVVAQGFRPQTQPLVVPGTSEDYVVAMTPLP